MDLFPFELLQGGYIKCDTSWGAKDGEYTATHRLYIPMAGHGHVESGSKRMTLSARQVYLLPGGRWFRAWCARSVELYWLHFRPGDLSLDVRLSHRADPVTWPARQWASWRPTVDQIVAALRQPRGQADVRVQAMLLHFVGPALLADVPKKSTVSSRLDDAMEQAMAYMDEHFTEHPALEQVAAVAHLSPVYFHRKFKQLLSRSPRQYMLERTMQLAWQLIAREGRSVGFAAEQCGYTNAFYFSRVFSRYFGFPPSQASAARSTPRP